MTGPVLITGGLGFIGQAVTHSLRADGVAVRILDNLSNPSITPEQARALGAEVVIGDVVEREVCRAAAGGAWAILHLAAQTYVLRSLQDPYFDLDVNGRGTLNLLEAARLGSARVFVFASTNAVAGIAVPPFSEDAALHPLSPYGCTKLLGEAYCAAYASCHGLRSVSLRFSNVFGPGSWRKGSVVATFIRQALMGEPITVDGDGGQTRDFLFIDDLVAAIRLALHEPPAGEVFCIGAGHPTTITELLARLDRRYRAWSGQPLAIRHGPPRKGDIRDNWSDVSKAVRLLGYQPRVDLDQALERTFDWFLLEWLPRRQRGEI